MEQSQVDNNVAGYTGGGQFQERIVNIAPTTIRILWFVQTALSLLIFGMEIGIIVCYVLVASKTESRPYANSAVGPLTAAGIWASIVMDIAIFCLRLLRRHQDEERWWRINIITQVILFVFSIILIGITGDYVNKHRVDSDICGYVSSEEDICGYIRSKYSLHQAQLAFAVLMMFSVIPFIALFLYFQFVVRSFPLPGARVHPLNRGIQPIKPQPIFYPRSSAQPPPINPVSTPLGYNSASRQIHCPSCHTTLTVPASAQTHNYAS